jgi:purine-binding chemotaxis protein CheW
MQNTVAGDESAQVPSQDSSMSKYLTFWTDGELFGIPISDVVQIISMQEITPLPDFPDYLKGVINLRGNIIPVIDIRIRFGKPEAEYNESTCIIVTSIEDSYMGFIVDSVDEVTDLDEDNISPAPKVSKNITNRYLSGIGQIEDNVVLLLDVAKIFAEKEWTQVQEATAQNQNPSEADKQPEKPENPIVELRNAAETKTSKGE